MLKGGTFGGVAVQLFFWSQVFYKHGWKVYSLTRGDNYNDANVIFKHIPSIRIGSLIVDFIVATYYVLIIKPDIILMRGASNRLFALSLVSRLWRRKLIFMGASDVNFEPGKETINNAFNKRLFQIGLKHIKYIITQNDFQTEAVKNNYQKTPLQLNSIWGRFAIGDHTNENLKPYQIVWIANIRKLKRLEWFVNVANRLPQYSFAVAGGFAEPRDYKEKLLHRISQIKNLEYLGGISLPDSNKLVEKSQLLVCTSEFEGFPNTFLQAWSFKKPVVSTVNPNGVITKYGLGYVVENEDGLLKSIQELIDNTELYKEMQKTITSYFDSHHGIEKSYESMIEYVMN